MTTSLQHTSLGELSYSPLLATSLGELGIVEIEEEAKRKIHPPGMGRWVRRDGIIEEEDEIVIAVVMAFLEIID